MFPIFLPIDDQLFPGLAMLGDTQDRVLVALEVPVATRRDQSHFCTFPISLAFLWNSSSQPRVRAAEIVVDWRSSSGDWPQ